MKLRAIDLTLSAVFVALMAVGANVTSLLVIGGVPITLQTFFGILAGLILGSRLGAIAMVAYTCIGLVGVPIFSKFQGGPGALISPTFGFILSYILVAYVVGKMVEASSSKNRFVIAALVGMVINYVIGTNWMYAAMKLWAEAPEAFSYGVAWAWMAVPLPKDILLSVVAGVVAPRLYKNIQKSTGSLKQKSAA
jgi:biotin transport system substrate-specific component